MKDITKFLNESLDEIQHDTKKQTFTMSRKGELTYYDSVVTYPIQTKDAFEIETLTVKDDSRRQGIGSALLKDFLDYISTKNCRAVVYASPLDPKMSDEDVIEFYKKHGFVQDIRIKDEHCLIWTQK